MQLPSEVPARMDSPSRIARPLLVVTWLTMVWGAATRAYRAGVACPDWPLCHGRLVPSIHAAAYPVDPRYEVYRVYLEFVHRALAGTVACAAIWLAASLFRNGRRAASYLLLLLLLAQVAMGAITVALRNAPFTVVLHLAIGLAFLTSILAFARQAPRGLDLLDPVWRAVSALVAVQILVGGVISTQSFGLACHDFPFCNGFPVPIVWTSAIAWQFAHRVFGFAVVGMSVIVAISTFAFGSPPSERRLGVAFAAAAIAQAFLGGINVWYRIPPAASALHLGLAVVAYALVASRAVPLRRNQAMAHVTLRSRSPVA